MDINGIDISDAEIKKFQETVRSHSSYDINDYSLNSLKRRLLKVTEECGLDMSGLIRTISEDPVALEEVVKKLSVKTTMLFRDPQVWISIMRDVLPRFRKHDEIRIWHPGCSTGQEVYSLMILLEQAGLLERSRIYASDINEDVLEIARNGQYRLRFNREYIDNFKAVFSKEQEKATGRSFTDHTAFFQTDETTDRINMHEHLCEKPIYRKMDLVRDDNLFRKSFDLVICRNVIIYFNFNLQNRVLRMFHRNLRKNGILVLGLHESIIGPGSKLFRKSGHFYVRTPAANSYPYAE